MTRYQAASLARDLWYRRANYAVDSVGDRRGATCTRRKSVAGRFEVGFIELSSTKPERWTSTILGRGDSWEAAFAMAALHEVNL